MRTKRVDNEGIINDIHEKDTEFMRHDYDNALFVADYLGWTKIECSCDNKMKSIDQIHDEIINIFK
jgi:dTMP kinase